MPSYRSLGTLREVLGETPWPVDFFSPDDLPEFLDKIYVQDAELALVGDVVTGRLWLAFEGEVARAIPGLDGALIVVGGAGIEGLTSLAVTLTLGAESSLTLHNLDVALRFDP